MSFRNSRRYKIVLWGLTLACLGGAGFLGYKTFFAAPAPARLLKAAEDAYARGEAAYKDKKWDEAATKFDEAKLHADNAIQALEEQAKEGKVTAEELGPLNGKIMWVRARAVRDKAYAKGQVEKKPLAEFPDPQYSETFRLFAAIPDPDELREAIMALRIAADRLPTDPEVLKESLRFELAFPQIMWSRAEPQLRRAVEQDQKNARAHYYLARYEFDQPGDDMVTPAAPARRSADRVEKARDHLKAVKEAAGRLPGKMYWRTTGLEAEILDWPVRTATARKLKPEAAEAAERALDQFLFDPATGAVGAAGRGESLAGFNRADATGLTSVLLIGMDRAVAAARKTGGTPDRIRDVWQAALDAATKTGDDAALKVFMPDILAALTAVTGAAQPYLMPADPGRWRGQEAAVEALVAKTPEAAKARPQIGVQLAQIGFADAAAAAGVGDGVKAKELAEGALKKLEDGLKAAEEARSTPVYVEEVAALLAERKLMLGARHEAVEPYIAKLRNSESPRIRQFGKLYEAFVAERQGKLDKARKLLQEVAADRTNVDVAFRANVLLAGIASVTRDPAAALGALEELKANYQKLEGASVAAREWADRFIGGPEAIAAKQVVGNLDVALQIAARYRRDNPGKPLPKELLNVPESLAIGKMKELRPPSLSYLYAGLGFARYYTLNGRRAEAETLLGTLTTDYPKSIDVLRARCALLALPTDGSAGLNPNGQGAADALINKFIQDYPGDKAGPLFRAEWLVNTNRAADAVQYLRNPENFPGGRDAAVDRVLAAALAQTGDQEEAKKLLRGVPHTLLQDAALIRATVDRAAREKQLQEALERYENQGAFRLDEAMLRLSERKFEEAIRGFASAIEFTEVSAAARAWLVRALLSYAAADPVKAREAAVRLAAENPDEPGLYLAAANAALTLDEVGAPGDKWEVVKSAYAAMARWEAAAAKAGMKREEVALIRAGFFLQAGDPDAAKREATASFNQTPKHVPTALFLAELYLLRPADAARAREFLAAVARENPDHPRLPYMEALALQVEGKWDAVTAAYQKLLQAAPRDPGLNGLLVSALDRAGKKDEALRQAEDWKAKIPDDPRAWTEIIRLLAAAGKKAEAAKAADGFLATQAERVKKMLAEMKPVPTATEQATALDGFRAGTLLQVAAAYAQAPARDEALARLDEAAKLRPAILPALFLRGDIAVAQKDWDRALSVYREILKQNPRDFIAGNNVAWILAEKKNEPAAALAFVEDVRKGRHASHPIAAERLPADFLDTLGLVYTKLNQADKFPKMREDFEAAVKRYPTDPRMHLYLGAALAAVGERSKALDSLDTATRLAGTKSGLTDEQNKAVIEAAETHRKRIRG